MSFLSAEGGRGEGRGRTSFKEREKESVSEASVVDGFAIAMFSGRKSRRGIHGRGVSWVLDWVGGWCLSTSSFSLSASTLGVFIVASKERKPIKNVSVSGVLLWNGGMEDGQERERGGFLDFFFPLFDYLFFFRRGQKWEHG